MQRQGLKRSELPRCSAGECAKSLDEIKSKYPYIKEIKSRSGGKLFHVIEARDGFYAFVEMNGKFYSTGRYETLAELEDYVF